MRTSSIRNLLVLEVMWLLTAVDKALVCKECQGNSLEKSVGYQQAWQEDMCKREEVPREKELAEMLDKAGKLCPERQVTPAHTGFGETGSSRVSGGYKPTVRSQPVSGGVWFGFSFAMVRMFSDVI